MRSSKDTMDNPEVEVLEKSDEVVKFKWRGKIYIERLCHACKGSCWTTLVKNKKGMPCRTCFGKGSITRRV